MGFVFLNVITTFRGVTGAAEVKKLEIASSAVGGVYYVMGSTLADVLHKKLGKDFPIIVSVTRGSGENVRLLEQNRVEVAIAASNALYLSWAGQKPYKKEYRGARVVTRICPNHSLFYALAGKGIASIKDLKGKRVGVGTGPTTWDVLTGPVLEAHGIDYRKDIKRVYAGFSDLANQVRDGLIDAAIGTVSAGQTLQSAIAALAAEKELVFLEYDPRAVEEAVEKVPYFTKQIIPAGKLPGVQKDFLCVDIGTVSLVVRDDLQEEFVYKITKIIHQSVPELESKIKLFQYILKDPKFMVKTLGGPAFHPGSIRYYKEIGLWQK